MRKRFLYTRMVLESAMRNFVRYLTICIAERYSLANTRIHFLHGERRHIQWVGHDIRLHLHMLHGICGDVEQIIEFVKEWEIDLFEQLQVTENILLLVPREGIKGK